MGPWLMVRRAELQEGLKTLSKLAKARQLRAEALVSFSKGLMNMSVPGIKVDVPADGSWLARVRVPARFLIGLAGSVPDEDPLLIRVEQDRFIIGGHAVPCTRDHIEHAVIKLPLNALFADILGMGLDHSPEEIERSGLTRLVGQAGQRRESLIRRATVLLQPLGVKVDSLRWLVDESIRGSDRVAGQPRSAARHTESRPKDLDGSERTAGDTGAHNSQTSPAPPPFGPGWSGSVPIRVTGNAKQFKKLILAGLDADWRSVLQALSAVLDTISPREREVMRLRLGLADGYSQTLKEVGEQLKVSSATAGRIERKAFRKLAHPSRWKHLRAAIERALHRAYQQSLFASPRVAHPRDEPEQAP